MMIWHRIACLGLHGVAGDAVGSGFDTLVKHDDGGVP